MKQYTIKDIAALSGVGISTVSRVLNNRPDVSEETKKRVMDVVKMYSYTPNLNAKNLKQRSPDLLLVLVRGRQNSFLNDIAERIAERGSQLGQNFLLDFIDETDDEFAAARRHIAEKQVVGIIFIGSNTVGREGEIAALGTPCVFATVDTSGLALPGVSSVSVDNREGARMAVEHLLGQGHRHIAVFGGVREMDDGIGQRYQGVLRAFREHGLAFDASLYVECSFAMEKAYRTALAFCREGRQFTAIFAMSDSMAIGIIRALADSGLRVPQDVSVVGFDGIALTRFTLPALTTVAQPATALADTSVELIVRLLEDPADTENVLVDCGLLQGESVRPVQR